MCQAENHVVETSAKLKQEYVHTSTLRLEISKLRAELAEARSGVKNAENAAQTYYDQGFDEAAVSLKS